jgi:hypothetical protein
MSGEAPDLFILAIFFRIATHSVLDGTGVLSQAVAFGPFTEKGPGIIAGRQ